LGILWSPSDLLPMSGNVSICNVAILTLDTWYMVDVRASSRQYGLVTTHGKRPSVDVRGRWRLWSRYQLREGVICRSPRATLVEYDPWDLYRENLGRYRTVQQPYVSLLELARELTSVRASNYVSLSGAGQPEEGETEGTRRQIVADANAAIV